MPMKDSTGHTSYRHLGLEQERGKAGTEARRILRRSQNSFVFNKKLNHSGKFPERNSPQTV